MTVIQSYYHCIGHEFITAPTCGVWCPSAVCAWGCHLPAQIFLSLLN